MQNNRSWEAYIRLASSQIRTFVGPHLQQRLKKAPFLISVLHEDNLFCVLSQDAWCI